MVGEAFTLCSICIGCGWRGAELHVSLSPLPPAILPPPEFVGSMARHRPLCMPRYRAVTRTACRAQDEC